MYDALIVAGADPIDVSVSHHEGLDQHVHVRGRHKHFSVTVVIQCGMHGDRRYFLANHMDAEGDIYCLNPGFIPEDPKWMAETVLKYLKNPKWSTSHPLTLAPADESRPES